MSASLRDATVQEIQLELIRRTNFNAFDGERIHASLIRHRKLWLAALLDRPGVPNYRTPTHLLIAGLIKLRDLPQNYWNADTLYLLTKTHASATKLAGIARSEDWGGEIIVFEDQNEIDNAMGGGREDCGIVSIWWD